MLEKHIEAYLRRRVEALGGECLKFTAQRGVPDRIVFMPGGQITLVELKTAGRKPGDAQLAWQRRFIEMGFNCVVVDSQFQVDSLINELQARP